MTVFRAVAWPAVVGCVMLLSACTGTTTDVARSTTSATPTTAVVTESSSTGNDAAANFGPLATDGSPTPYLEVDVRDPSLFAPLGAADCSPPSPYLDWFETDGAGGLAEIRATSTDVEIWGLLWQTPPLAVGVEIKMVWRVTGSGQFNIRAIQNVTEAEQTWGPSLHHASNFERPGDEWGTAFIFPSPGCWEIEITRGVHMGSVWVEVES